MLNIAIDGLSGSGKSTIARLLADRLEIKCLNTGEIYRAFACAFQDFGYSTVSEETVKDLAKRTRVKIEFEGKKQFVYIDGKEYGTRLRTEEISALTPEVALFKVLRKKVLKLQRDFAKHNDCVMEGRDIGSHVLPHAKFKLFITATAEERARRRYEQLKGTANEAKYEDILKELNARDYADIHREVSPLVPTKKSYIIDTTNMTIEQTIDYIENIIRAK